jgi:hypothetical protein
MLKRLLLERVGVEPYDKLELISLTVLGVLIPVVVLGIPALPPPRQSQHSRSSLRTGSNETLRL